MNLFLIALGGALGSVARFSLSGLVHRWFGMHYPYGTLSVNLIGSLAIGILWGSFGGQVPAGARAFLIAGFLGGFTTFSAFSLETLNLLRDGHTKWAVINFLANNIAGFLLAAAGYFLARTVKS